VQITSERLSADGDDLDAAAAEFDARYLATLDECTPARASVWATIRR
jgi:hypothetical protein